MGKELNQCAVTADFQAAYAHDCELNRKIRASSKYLYTT